MHAQYFALINLYLKLQFCVMASFSLLLILLPCHRGLHQKENVVKIEDHCDRMSRSSSLTPAAKKWLVLIKSRVNTNMSPSNCHKQFDIRNNILFFTFSPLFSPGCRYYECGGLGVEVPTACASEMLSRELRHASVNLNTEMARH